MHRAATLAGFCLASSIVTTSTWANAGFLRQDTGDARNVILAGSTSSSSQNQQEQQERQREEQRQRQLAEAQAELSDVTDALDEVNARIELATEQLVEFDQAIIDEEDKDNPDQADIDRLFEEIRQYETLLDQLEDQQRELTSSATSLRTQIARLGGSATGSSSTAANAPNAASGLAQQLDALAESEEAALSESETIYEDASINRSTETTILVADALIVGHHAAVVGARLAALRARAREQGLGDALDATDLDQTQVGDGPSPQLLADMQDYILAPEPAFAPRPQITRGEKIKDSLSMLAGNPATEEQRELMEEIDRRAQYQAIAATSDQLAENLAQELALADALQEELGVLVEWQGSLLETSPSTDQERDELDSTLAKIADEIGRNELALAAIQLEIELTRAAAENLERGVSTTAAVAVMNPNDRLAAQLLDQLDERGALLDTWRRYADQLAAVSSTATRDQAEALEQLMFQSAADAEALESAIKLTIEQIWNSGEGGEVGFNDIDDGASESSETAADRTAPGSSDSDAAESSGTASNDADVESVDSDEDIDDKVNN